MTTDAWLTTIKHLMAKNKLTQRDLAEKIGVTRGQIGHYITGRRVPSLEKQKLLAQALDITLDELHYPSVNGQPRPRYIPILNWEIACNWKEAIDELDSNIAFLPVNPADVGKHVFALTVDNDSMRSSFLGEKSFSPGEKIIVDPERTPQTGNFVIAIANKENSAIFRQYIADGSRKYLKPLNAQYPTIQITKNTRIIAVVFGKLDINI